MRIKPRVSGPLRVEKETQSRATTALGVRRRPRSPAPGGRSRGSPVTTFLDTAASCTQR